MQCILAVQGDRVLSCDLYCFSTGNLHLFFPNTVSLGGRLISSSFELGIKAEPWECSGHHTACWLSAGHHYTRTTLAHGVHFIVK